uniref:DUF4874 domain-containing protein n=1 Tax=Meloidogyne hapla TaxID=6305 RepID=A0A1I8B551_MELHA
MEIVMFMLRKNSLDGRWNRTIVERDPAKSTTDCATIQPDDGEAIIKTLDYLDDNNAKFDRVWLLIYTWPGFGQGWSNDKDKNVEIIEEMIITLKERNLTYGIYTAKDYWINITGNTKKFCDSPLFYVNHDGKNNFDDFYKNPFGGWEEPTIKLYGCKATDDASICSLWKPNY